ncbi:IgGFc-binding protein-like [Liolophura sinensis]|uniref:IgGFc-binding protein-like n=1 Tax=Liolophura sinensis TaxID=3198878 RepID=UPI003158AB40
MFFWPVITVFCAPDNAGREFLVVYMENAADTFSTELELYVTTSHQSDVRVNVTSPQRGVNGVDEQFVVRSGYVHRLFISYHLRLIGSAKSGNALLVRSDEEVVVYTVNKEIYTNDAYLALPTDVLEHQYFTVSYYPATYKTQFAVAATDDCIVSVTLPNPQTFLEVVFEGTSYYNGDTFDVSLSKFESFQIQSDGDLTGTSISADKPIAVFSGNQRPRVNGYSTDHLAEQLPPVSTWGKMFAVVPTPNRTVGDFVKCVASEDQTSLTVSGYGTYSIGEAGQSIQLSVSSEDFVSIHADKPILVVQIVKSQETAKSEEKADPAMSVIYPVEQFSADCTISTPEYSQNGAYTNSLLIVVKDSQTQGLRLDHAPLGDSVVWTPFVGLNYSGAQISISHGSHTLYHIIPTVTFGGILYGYAQYEAFSLPLGVRLAPVNLPCIVSFSLSGDGFDNDCDGRIDEEICDDGNKDDDEDGQIDEDCASPSVYNIGTVSETAGIANTTANPTTATSGIVSLTNEYNGSTVDHTRETELHSPILPSCPKGWFSCGSPPAHCLENAFLCDCHEDCPGGWDETLKAGCTHSDVEMCQRDSGSRSPQADTLNVIAGVIVLAVFEAAGLHIGQYTIPVDC